MELWAARDALCPPSSSAAASFSVASSVSCVFNLGSMPLHSASEWLLLGLNTHGVVFGVSWSILAEVAAVTGGTAAERTVARVVEGAFGAMPTVPPICCGERSLVCV